jgi:eukaryotic-like serine/threonine-protein kinase
MIDENRYKMGIVLGRGAMGTVYKAVDRQIGREVAIKILHPHLLADEMAAELCRRFEQEVRAAARCQHPNIVTVYDCGMDKHSPYMVMEYVKGLDLQVFLKSGQVFSAGQAINVILKVLDALSAAHAMGVVHRDIKPANIMLLENGQVKVMDFGVARLDTSELTQLGDVLGTPCYMSPEALNGEATNNLSDLYTTALVLLELLIKKRLKSETIGYTTLAVELEKQGLTAHILANLASVLTKALQKQPHYRYQSASEFSKDLAACLEATPDYYHLSNDLVATVLKVQTQLKFNQIPPDKNTETLFASDSVLLQNQLSLVEKSLTRYVGPVAKMLVKKYAQKSNDFDQFLDSLIGYIPSETERQIFIDNLQSSGIRKGTGSRYQQISVVASRPPEKIAIPADYIEQLIADLSHYLGPMASHLVKAAQKKASSKKDLCALLAEKIPNSDERSRFLTTWSRK